MALSKKKQKELEALETEDTKHCTVCREIKPLFEFGINPNRRKFAQSQCTECDRKRAKENRIQKFGITLKQYDKILKKQGGKCKICGAKTPGYKNRGRFCVDHNHVTGKIRGLLCVNCNLGLGHFKDNVEILDLAKQYLMGQ